MWSYKDKINKSVLHDFLRLEKNGDCKTHITAKKNETMRPVKFSKNFARLMVFKRPFTTPTIMSKVIEIKSCFEHLFSMHTGFTMTFPLLKC